MMRGRTSASRDGWKLAALVSMMFCFTLLFLWLGEPGELYKHDSNGTEYWIRADFGRLLILRWSGQAGMDLLWNLPLWPFVMLTALLPLWALWKFGLNRSKQRREFPAERTNG